MTEFSYKNPDENIFDLKNLPEKVKYIENINQYNLEEGLALSFEEIDYLDNVSKRLERKLTDSEVFGFSQVNSEHSRHKILNGKFIGEGTTSLSNLAKIEEATWKL